MTLLLLFLALVTRSAPRSDTFRQDTGIVYTTKQGLPDNDIRSIALSGTNVWAAAKGGIVLLATGKTSERWRRIASVPAVSLASDENGGVYTATARGFFHFRPEGKSEVLAGLEAEAGKQVLSSRQGGIWCLTGTRLFQWNRQITLTASAPADMELDYVLEDGKGRVFVGARRRDGGYSSGERGTKISYIRQLLRLENSALTLNNRIRNTQGRSVSDELQCGAAGSDGTLWIGTPNGLVMTDGDGFRQGIDGREGLPYNDTACVAVATNGDLWTGTEEGACRMHNGQWSYFRGRRWLPGNKIRAIVPDNTEGAWLATDGGIAHIASIPMTLAAKAAHYEEINAARHNREGYVTICNLPDPEDLSRYEIEASDNDGLWTSLYAAAECFRYAATKDPEARKLAQKSMNAILDLERLTGISGFPARSVARRDEKHIFRLQGEWHPSTIDPRYDWKGDTSSDELDGHYFIYPLYYDLVADEKEKEKLRAAIARMTDHLLKNNYQLVDLDGKPTRWAIFNPENLNDNPQWEEERGLNSLSMLAYLKVAHHITGEARFAKAYEDLIQKHHYLLNTLLLKQLPPYAINYSDDQLTFLGYYSLLRLETNPEYRRLLLMSLERTWQVVRPERSSLFNLIYGALTGNPCDAAQARTTLEEWPWDLRHWQVENSQRSDIKFGEGSSSRQLEGTRVLPYSERRAMQWSDNPYILDGGEAGKREYDGAAWLLSYWLGRYAGLL